MAKLTLQDIASGYQATTIVNSNNDAVEQAIENTLSRDGTAPNDMQVSLDMGGFQIINLGAPTHPTDAVRVVDIESGTIVVSPSVAWTDITAKPATVVDVGILVDPNADRLLFWDDSAGHIVYLTLGTGLSITGTTISSTVSSVAYGSITAFPSGLTQIGALVDPNADRILFWDDSAGANAYLAASTGLAITGTNITLSHLGIQSLVDPNADRIFFWDDSAGTTAFLTVGTGLTITGTTLSANAAATYVTSLGLLADPNADRIIFWDDSASNLQHLQTGTYVGITGTTLDLVSDTGSFTGTLTGVTGTVTGTVKYTVVGNRVTIEFPTISGTPNSTAHTITGGPVNIRPTTAQRCLGTTLNNNVEVISRIVAETTGTFTLYNVLSATFANTVTEGVTNCTITYHKS